MTTLCPVTTRTCENSSCVHGLAGICFMWEKAQSTWRPNFPDGVSAIKARESTHGDWSKQSQTAQSLKKVCRDTAKLPPSHQEALDLICTKISRILCGNPNEIDHWTDISGYATLIANQIQGIKSGDVK